MAQTRYGDLRDTFHVSRFTNNGLLRQVDFFSILLDDRYRLDNRRLPVPTPPMISSILFRINGMEARRMTGRQQLRIGTDDSQPQGLEFQRQRQMQDLW